MKQASAKRPTKRQPAQTAKAARPAEKAPAKQPAPKPAVDTDRYKDLWARFEEEAGFTGERLAQERQKILDDIASLEVRVQEKRDLLSAIDGRVEAARDQMRALLGAHLSDDAILSAMRVEYKVKRVGAAKGGKATSDEPLATEDKQFVFDNLDAEGLSVNDLKRVTGKSARFLQSALHALLEEGRITKTGERGAARFHLL